jgi:nicotinamide phosphoribosyltransferase
MYRRILQRYADETNPEMGDFVQWQGHDFSMRGMASVEAAAKSGAGHLLSFNGTDTVPSIQFLKRYYGATGFVGGSVPATEHSVMCAGSQESEFDTFKRLITEVYPKGIVSIVSDTWDFWNVVQDFLPRLKPIILAREGKVVIRPDSGDPVNILCGDPDAPVGSVQHLGLVEALWHIFGGTTTSKGFKVLDSHIGAIYGDSITLERQKKILERLHAKNFASTNVVLGIGSYTYQYTTRDTFGWAIKATYAETNGKPVNLFKAPKTDDGTKFSAVGLPVVKKNSDGTIIFKDRQDYQSFDSPMNDLDIVYKDGNIVQCPDLNVLKSNLFP